MLTEDEIKFIKEAKLLKVTNLAKDQNIEKQYRSPKGEGPFKLSVLTKGQNLKKDPKESESKEASEGLLLSTVSSITEDERHLNFTFMKAQWGDKDIMKYVWGGVKKDETIQARLSAAQDRCKHQDPTTLYQVFKKTDKKEKEGNGIAGKDIIDQAAIQQDKFWEKVVAFQNWEFKGTVVLEHGDEITAEKEGRGRSVELRYTSLPPGGKGEMTEAAATVVLDILPQFKRHKETMYWPADKSSKDPLDHKDWHDLFSGEVVATARADNKPSCQILTNLGMEVDADKSGYLFAEPHFRYYFRKK